VVTPEEAIACIRPADLVVVPLFPPRTLTHELGKRVTSLPGIRIRQVNALSDPGWFQAAIEGARISVESEAFIGVGGRVAAAAGATSFVPNLFSRRRKPSTSEATTLKGLTWRSSMCPPDANGLLQPRTARVEQVGTH
jgi:hypothetical protein